MRLGSGNHLLGGGDSALLEVPVTIREPNKPLGTHIFTAMGRTDSGGLRWTEVTIDGGDGAKEALERITIPQDVLDQIAPTAVPRSSIIISDEPLNSETNYRTEFVVVLNNQPQGGLAMRHRPDDAEKSRSAVSARMALRNAWDDDDYGSNPQRGWGTQYGYGYGYARQRSGQNFFERFFQPGSW